MSAPPIGLFRRLVAGVDGSTGSRRALEWTAELGASTGAEVLAVHVLTYNHEFLRDVTADTMRTWRRDLLRDLETSWTQPLNAIDVRHTCHVVEADSASEGLLDIASRAGADLIVVGSRGHGGIADRVLGGVSYRVTHRALQPVVVVPPDWAAVARSAAAS